MSERKYRSANLPDTRNITEQRTAEFVEQQRSHHSLHLSKHDLKVNNVNIPIHSLEPLNPTAQPFAPTQRNEAQELAKFMVKKDLITSRLISFDDQPSHYSSWKISFQHIMTELDTNPLEQLDLLTKFLGPSSKQYAQNIRCANAHNPAIAVRLIWERLDARFGSPEIIESSLHSRIVNFPKLSNDNRKELYDLADLAAEIESIHTKPTTSKQTRFQSPTQVSSIKTDIGSNDNRPPFQKSNEDLCPLHGTNHTLNTCRGFRAKPLSERLDLIKQKGLCFKCCGLKKHFRDKCKENFKCSVCGSCDHPSALHVDVESEPQQKHEEENSNEQISSICTKICDSIYNTSKSCSKIVLAKEYHSDRPEHFKKVYCVLDDQSNRTLATSDFFNFFRENGKEFEYALASCAGRFVSSGRRASGYVLESLDGSSCLNVPEIIECNDIPNNREEIPSSVVASSYPHMMDIASCIPDIDNQSEIQMLIGRDLIRAHHVIEHRVGVEEVPYAQRLRLGWVIVGNVCLGRFQEQQHVNVNKTVIVGNVQSTLLFPCDSETPVGLDPTFEKFIPDKPLLENSTQRSNHGTKSFDMNLGCNSEKPTHELDTVASNCRSVLEAYQSDDLATNLKDLDLGSANLLLQMNLGLSWDTELDEFTLRVSSDNKPFPRRGFLSTVNSLYDPISLATPVIIKDKLFISPTLRLSSTCDWNNPFSESLNQTWESSLPSLSQLEHLPTQKKYIGPSCVNSVKQENSTFLDASKDAITDTYFNLNSATTVNRNFHFRPIT
ncbi:Hypothetical predicted protein [Mytilus galloprovincialis]|uniref:Peptidase aspartic putative domain-containing protein n=1 Tax=Mytilus galloprovincialis TaxID=29158 RepID=A0A8B6CT36_MYTGA|nr:Hypothetical predicted protein [Mytilus galloprovincialis]